ncbi:MULTISPECIES: TetR/AcrR family transcriptional regulator [Arthrobacter]|uniref:TetR/AcrR family transcriptional regulator n=1 Tax=Arthrobacter TaxID=1663 RepID=UPI001BE616AA|nr:MULTISPECIES: TetR/AcrR family transcriptional regulator [Arthrobacter]MBT2550797.1 TetR/AcrR family transcriptional regulator [Arthrobacter sp. ISL-65]MDQ0620420.1 AcrR family transcriptional regulator [Arthrobacter globiformis]
MSAPDATGDALLPPGVRTGHSEPVDRILATAYELFSHRGVRDVGINELIERSGVAKSTFYRHFPSKDALVLAFLALRDQVWTVDLIVSEARRRGTTPEGRLLAIFDVFGDWFQRDDFEACTFINVLLEMGPEHPLGEASIGYLARIRGHIQALADEAGLERPDEFARSWHILMKGSIISATEGDFLASKRAQQMAGWLIEHHRS